MSFHTFETLYAAWPTQADKAGTKAAWDYIYKKHSYSDQEYLDAQKLWLAQNPQHSLSLGGWLRDELFIAAIKEIKASGGITFALEHVQLYRDLSTVVMGEWNRLRRHWWTSVADIGARTVIVEAALRNEFFQKHWQKALTACRSVFEYGMRDNLGNIKLIPSIEWFCDVTHNHTASKLLEGYYGQPKRKTIIPDYQPEKLSTDDRVALADMVDAFKHNIGLGVKHEQLWTVRVSFTSISLRYKDKPIETKAMPLTNADQQALKDTMQNQADLFNKQGYRPSMEAPWYEDPKHNESSLSDLGLLE